MAKMKDSKPNGYALSRAWFDFAFENQGLVSGNHGCMFLWFLEKNNRMGWAKQFGAPRDETMAAVGITSFNTYRKIFSDLVDWGFIKVIRESKNQYTAHIIAISKNDQPLIQALDSALIQAEYKQEYQHSISIDTSTDTDSVAINKPINQKTINNKQLNKSIEQFQEIARTSFENVNCLFGVEFKKVWFDLIQQDNWKKKSQSAYDYNLKRLIKFDEEFAMALVETAIAGEYKGVVFSNTDIDYKKFIKAKTNGNNSHTTAASKDESRSNMVKLARSILSKNTSDINA